MQWKVINSSCGGSQLLITQQQGDNTATSISFPYDITGYDFSGTIKFPVPVSLAVGVNITIGDIIAYVGSISGNILTISSISSGSVYIGMPVNGSGVLPGTVIVSLGTGTGGVGTYVLNYSQTVYSTAMGLSFISMQLTSADTQNVTEGQYPFDLWSSVVSPATNSLVMTGFFEINEALTAIS